MLLVCVATLLAFGCYQQHWRWATALDNLMLDTSFRIRKPHAPVDVAESLPATRDIVMVELPHPVPRRLLAQLLWQLRDAKVVALDLMLVDQQAELHAGENAWYAEELQSWQHETRMLATAIKNTGNVIVGEWADETWVADARRPGVFTHRIVWQRPPSLLWEAAHYHAHLSVIPDADDHVVRRMPLFQDLPSPRGPTERLPCLGLAVAAAVSGVTPAELHDQLTRLTPTGGALTLGRQHINYIQDAMLTINYVGDRQCFEYSSNSVVYDRLLQLYSPEDFIGKTVIVGGTGLTSKDNYPTPYGMMAGMQLHANVVATLCDVSGSSGVVPPWFLLGLAGVCCLCAVLPLLRWPPWSSCLIVLGEVIILLFGGAELFAARHLVAPVSVPIIAIAFTYNALLWYEYSRACITLEKFIGVAMVKRAFHTMTRLRLGDGRLEDACAMFCDLRGFTALSEALPPDVLVTLLNEYTAMVVSVVERFHGRPIDFAGDGVFILFEEALAGRDYPLRAVQASLALRAEFAQRQHGWQAQGLPHQELGIALHTGRMVIGALGSEHFLKLGAAGDVVNVAARVQSLSSACGFDVLLTQEMYDRIHTKVPTEYCGTFPIRGRLQPVVVFGISATRQPEGLPQQ